ncbi:hypothetical protein WICPIJ_007703 [Wickerhamomyces pijperi]|uniref:ABC1 atypical kinase-like domain-containing protein n=1 Tax=Wickerhamomyces pijperi TaxID=599730 RepID=A0A9P8TJV6_WICPI|nr:hypothetical protein WICPIJ_007703 [Wickerhamomyces pijperi]
MFLRTPLCKKASERTLKFSTISRSFATSTTSKVTTPKSKRFSRLQKFTLFTGSTLALLFAYDYTFYESTLIRTARAFYNLGCIGYDYKFNFNENNVISELHERNATRLMNVLKSNKGLYIKFGQNLANQSAIFPKAFQEKFSELYDSATEDPYDKIQKTLSEELGPDYEMYFNHIDPVPIASASIGQVHKAQLITGENVAIKVQHPYIQKQIGADLMTFGAFSYLYEWTFGIPVMFMYGYISEHIGEEADFTIEVKNLERAKKFIEGDEYLKNKIHVPKVYHELCTERILTAEWCDGESLVNHDALKESKIYDHSVIMKDYLTLFSKMIFEWGFVHSDPHPGNLLVRLNPETKKQQLVLLDHGLYITLRESVRYDYCRLWKAIFELDEATLKEIAVSWGIGSDQSDMFGSMALLKPSHKMRKQLSELSKFEREKAVADNFKNFFADTEKFPLELIFLGKTMRTAQGVNQRFGAPVNRINIFTKEAVKGFYLTEPEFVYSWSNTLNRSFRYSIYSLIMSLSDLTFWVMKFSAWWFGTKNSEDLLEQKMKEEMKKMGIDVPKDVELFSG